eukprot:TRINITY_DN96515_c0_g1_i1.p1 TRINITY_DN96515_c0_g1~~TRINITY_DN96515_c0_g1_i1.p1  ORF type:complete len:116 (+),score=15.31 TRINITY_DN96515_c0_g1_i1:111-458(+)
MLDIVGGSAFVAIAYRSLRMMRWSTCCSCFSGEDEILPPPRNVADGAQRKSKVQLDLPRGRQPSKRGSLTPQTPGEDDASGGSSRQSRSRFKSSSSWRTLDDGQKGVQSRRTGRA